LCIDLTDLVRFLLVRGLLRSRQKIPYNHVVQSRTLYQLAEEIGAQLVGDGSVTVSSVNTLEDARPGQLSFLSNPKYEKQLATTQASAAIVGNNVQSDRLALLRAKDPYLAHQKAVVILHGYRKHPHTGIHPLAYVDPSAELGERVTVYPGVCIGPGVKIGNDCVLYPNVVVYDRCVIGDRVILHAGSVIGADGFGYATSGGVHHKIPQIGNVVLEDDVEVGANSTIDRAALGSTFIGKGTKIDNQVALGHNVKTGPGCLIVAQAGVAGSTTLGHHVVLGGQVGVAGHLEIGDQVMAAAQCGIIGSIEAGEVLLGSPSMPISHARRVYAIFRELPDLASRVRQLEKKLEKLSQGEK
jgi:UDP-3-O-[3-hydroxymyristoyl] glucosamine N-acyltransferase